MRPRDDEQRTAPDGRADEERRPSAPRTRLGLERLEERVTPSHFHGIDWYFEHNITPPHLYW